MFCSYCGKKIEDDSKFCYYCGAKINLSPEPPKNMIKNKMLEFTSANNGRYSKFMPINDMYVGISVDLEKYNMIYLKAQQLSDLCNKHFMEVYMQSVKTIDDVIKRMPDFFEDELSVVIHSSCSLLYNMGVIGYNDNNFINEFGQLFDYSKYFDVAIQAYNKIYQFEDWVEQYRSSQRGARSRWKGGGFGISGAIMGAATAGVMNSGMGVVRSLVDMRTDTKDDERIRKLKRDVLNAYPIQKRLSQGIEECCQGIFQAVFDTLENENIITGIEIDEMKADAIFDNAFEYEEDEEKYIQLLLRCIEMNPYDGRYYGCLALTCGDINNEIQDMAAYFGCGTLVNEIKIERFKMLKEENSDYNELKKCVLFLGLHEDIQI